MKIATGESYLCFPIAQGKWRMKKTIKTIALLDELAGAKSLVEFKRLELKNALNSGESIGSIEKSCKDLIEANRAYQLLDSILARLTR